MPKIEHAYGRRGLVMTRSAAKKKNARGPQKKYTRAAALAWKKKLGNRASNA